MTVAEILAVLQLLANFAPEAEQIAALLLNAFQTNDPAALATARAQALAYANANRPPNTPPLT
jgi:hypothetical protein